MSVTINTTACKDKTDHTNQIKKKHKSTQTDNQPPVIGYQPPVIARTMASLARSARLLAIMFLIVVAVMITTSPIVECGEYSAASFLPNISSGPSRSPWNGQQRYFIYACTCSDQFRSQRRRTAQEGYRAPPLNAMVSPEQEVVLRATTEKSLSLDGGYLYCNLMCQN